jgi:O-antigen/teichoic acid export membrane protein
MHRETLQQVSGYLGYGTINRVLGSLIGRLDQTLIGVWIGVAAAGIYAIPFLLSNSLNYMLAYMLGFIFPMASELHSLGEMDRLRDIFIRSSRFMAALAGLVFIPLVILGDLFLTLWTPSIAAQAVGVLRLLALAGYIGTSTASLTNNVMVGLGKMRQFTTYSIIRAAVLAALCFTFIRPLGLEGAGWALLLTCGIDIVYLFIVLRLYLQIEPWQIFRHAYFKPMMLGVGFAVLAFLLRPFAISWLGFGVVVGVLALVYFAAGFAIGIFGETEKKALLGIWELIVRRAKNSGRLA